MEVCIFNKNHKMKKSLLSHYSKCHQKEYKEIQDKGWYCKENTSNIFKDQLHKDKHDENCNFCKKGKVNEDISINGHEEIERKMSEPKKQIQFPIFDFDKYIKKVDKKYYLKKEDFKNEIDEEKNILY